MLERQQTHVYAPNMQMNIALKAFLFTSIVVLQANAMSRTLFDFTKLNNLDDWHESSDTVRTVGMSKAAITLQKTQVFQRAVFFSLLNPQPNGAGFAGVRVPVHFNLENFSNIHIKCRAQGQNTHYKVVFHHKNLHFNEAITYEQFFEVPISNEAFSEVTLPLSEFKPYFRGRQIPDAEPLDLENLTMFGLQIYGGVYLPFKQQGVSALEIETIEASS